MTRNPVTDVERPRLEQPEMSVLSEVEIARLWTAYGELEREATGAEAAWWRLARTITFTALGTAMRRGELLGLSWRDVQLLEGRLLRARGPRQRTGDHPKSRASRRLIELGPRTIELLADHFARTAFAGEDERVFCHPELGTPLDPSKLTRTYLQPALEAGRHHQALPGLPRPTPHRTDPRGCGGQSLGVRADEGRALPVADHRALHPRRASAISGSRGQGRGADVRADTAVGSRRSSAVCASTRRG